MEKPDKMPDHTELMRKIIHMIGEHANVHTPTALRNGVRMGMEVAENLAVNVCMTLYAPGTPEAENFIKDVYHHATTKALESINGKEAKDAYAQWKSQADAQASRPS